MKILLISMPSIHVIRWIENLKDANHELYWFDVLSRGRLDTSVSVFQFTDWKKRKIRPLKGEYFLYKKNPKLHRAILPYLESTANETLEKIILEIQPDIIHSFEMQACSYSILKTMNKFSKIPWLYSCWGNDLFYFENKKGHRFNIQKVLKRVNYIHTDCQRDYILAKKLGFSGNHVGVIPGGAGYEIEKVKNFRLPIENRNIILIKGYQHLFGRALNIIKAVEGILPILDKNQIVVFGAHKVIIDYIFENKLPIKVFNRHELPHSELLKLMGQSLIYIGNNISDGMPNTLLEAIIMGAFPIQSNPGGVSAEIIVNGKNGFLIEDQEDVKGIKNLIESAIFDEDLLKGAQIKNYEIASDKLDYDLNKKKIVQIYEDILLNY